MKFHIISFFLLFIIVFFLFCQVKPMKEAFEEDDKSIEIVVARYNEDLKWLHDEPFNQFDVIIYNKGDNEDFEKTDKVKKIVQLPNMGRDSYVYFHHIINNYDHLANVTIFFPGSINLERKYDTAKEVVYNVKEKNDTIVSCQKFKNNEFLENFRMERYLSSHPNNSEHNTDETMELAEIYPYGNWVRSTFKNGEKNNCISWCILSGLSKKHIQRKPISYYKQFYDQVSNHQNPEVGHYIERAWDAIFYPLSDSNKIPSMHG